MFEQHMKLGRHAGLAAGGVFLGVKGMPLGEDDQGDNLSLLRFAENMVEMSADEFGQLLLLSLGPPPGTQPADTMVDVTPQRADDE